MNGFENLKFNLLEVVVDIFLIDIVGEMWWEFWVGKFRRGSVESSWVVLCCERGDRVLCVINLIIFRGYVI